MVFDGNLDYHTVNDNSSIDKSVEKEHSTASSSNSSVNSSMGDLTEFLEAALKT
jgi:hypothetical protein